MTNFSIEHFVRTTFGGASNIADGKPLSEQQMDEIVAYLKSPGSGPDPSTSYVDFIGNRIRELPPELSQGVDYVGFSGVDDSEISNYHNAREYNRHVRGTSGIIGDTPWGKFIQELETSPARAAEMRAMEDGLADFMQQQGTEPWKGNHKGAVLDLMWNAGSPQYFENAIATGKPLVVFGSNAPANRGFSNFELTTALEHPQARINGYPVSAFGSDPLTFVRNSSKEYQQLENALVEEAGRNSGHEVSLERLRAQVKPVDGLDAGNRTLYGLHLEDFKALSLNEMTGVRAEWTATRAAAAVEPTVDGAALKRVAGVAGGTALGLAATAYEAHETGQRVQTLLQEKNATAAKSEALHFAASSLGGWTGGAIAAFAVGSSGAGPMALIAADAYLFSKAFEKAAILRDNHTVYHQTDKAGTEWQYNGYSWVRESMMDRTDDGVDNPIKQQVNATYEKTRELNALANARAVELELGKVPPPQNPFNIPARAEDQRGLDNANWHRNPENGEWARQVKSQVVGANDRGTYTTEVASPERARQLDAEAVDRVQSNVSNGPEAVAAAYLQHRAEQRFSDFGAAIPAAVTHAQAKPDAVFGSDGQLYKRNEDGRWIHGGKVAQGNLALELELTQQMRQPTLDKAAAALAEVEARPAPTPAEAERSELLHRYQSYNVRLEEDWVPAIELANARTREAHGITGRTVQELQPGADGLYTRDSAIGHYAVGEDGALRRVATTTGEDVRQAYAELQAQHQDAPPIQAVSERRIDALTPQQAEAHEQALREANRQGLSKEEAGQAAMLAAAQLGNREPLQALDAVDIATSASHAERDSTANDAASVEPRPAWLNTPPPQSPPATTPTEQDTSPQQTQQREQEPARAEQERARNEHAAAAENELNAHQAQLRQQPADHSAPAESPATPVHQTTPVEPTTAAPPHTPEAHSQPAPLQEQAQPEPEAPPIHDDQAPKLASQLPIYEAHPEESLPAPEQAYTAVAPEPVASQPEPNLADEPAPGRLEPSDPAHPANALYLQVREQVEKLDERLGRTYDENSERLTDSLMVLAKENGLQRVDHVVLSNQVGDNPAGYNVFVVQGELDNPAHRRAAMPTEQAVTTPHEESMAKLDVLLQQDAELEQQVNQQRQQEHDNMQQEMQFAVMQMGGGGGGG